MKMVTGAPASAGLAMGTVRRLRHVRPGLGRQVGEPRYEMALYEGAVRVAEEELVQLEKKAAESDRDIFMVQRMMLRDGGLAEEIRNYIRVGAGAAAAVERAAGIYAQRLRELNDSYLSERATDVLDACHRVVDVLDGGAREVLQLTEPCILASEEIYPTDIVTLERSLLLGFVTSAGAANAHAAILARTMGIPAVVMAGDAFLEQCNGLVAALDGEQGVVYFMPDEVTKARFSQKQHMQKRHSQALERLKDRPCVTQDGTHITLLANCTSVEEVHEAIVAGADGIGLLRSEYVMMAGKASTEDEQYHFYKACLEAAQGKPVTATTYEAQPSAAPRGTAETNPALGVRGVRYCFAHRTFFVQQLCAMLRAAVHGPLRILLPMVATAEDVSGALAEIEHAKAVLQKRGTPFAQQIEVGVLVETPASAIMASELAQGIDFFNIGTHDLTQYTYAVDRSNPQLQHYFSGKTPAVAKLVKYVVESAREAKIPVCVSGEDAADTGSAYAYIQSGVRQLSMATRCLPEMKEYLLSATIAP